MTEFNQLSRGYKILIIALILVFILATFYAVKNFKDFNSIQKIFLLLAGCVVVFGVINFVRNNDFKKLINHYGITKGSIERYNVESKLSLPSRGLSNSRNRISFTYQVENKRYKKMYSQNGFVDVPDKKPDLTMEYIVIYQSDNPQNSFLLLNYPIRSKSELDRYRRQFLEKIPDDAFKK